MLKNPEAPLRTAYVAALTPIQPTYAKKVPKSATVPKQYIVIGAQTKDPTEKGKEGCMEWLCTITVDVFNVNPSGYAAPGKNDAVEEQIVDTIEAGIIVDGFMVKSTDFVQSSDLSVETPTESIERRVIVYQHWLAQI